jgi:hypothetical protein
MTSVFRPIIFSRMNPSTNTRAGGELRIRLARAGCVCEGDGIIAFTFGMD